MYNWNVDIKELRKDKKQYTIWKIEQMVNFGLGGGKLNRREVKKYWNQLYLDPKKKEFLRMLLWPRKRS